MGMRCVGALLFTELLRPFLRSAASDGATRPGSTRGLWLTSNLIDTTAPFNGVEFAQPEHGYLDGPQNYAASKAGTWILARELGRRYGHGADGIVSLAVNPGVARAGSYAGTSWAVMAVLNIALMHDTIYGAYTELYAGLSPDIRPEDQAGLILPWGRIGSVELAWRQDIIRAIEPESEGGLRDGEKLWNWCEEQWTPHLK
ncbi:hypothetical protein F5X97DRAFT_341765 [Nemania serpens]|nr:hypothetical protein F5X97DRAFT_341765 [Nemania serpens]